MSGITGIFTRSGPFNNGGITSAGATAQNVNVTDLICEGPIKGLTEGASSLFLDDVSVEDAKFAEFVAESSLNGDITFSGSAVGTVASNVNIGVLEFDENSPRSVHLLYKQTTATLVSDTTNSENTTRTLRLDAVSGTPFDSSWNTGAQLSNIAFASVSVSHPNASGIETGFNIVIDSNTISFNVTPSEYDYPTSGTYTVSLYYAIPITAIDGLNNTITLAATPASGSYEFFIGEQLQLDDDGLVAAGSASVVRRINNLNIDFRRGDLQQPVTSSVGGVGGSVSVAGNTGLINLTELKIISQAVSTSEGIGIFDKEGLPNTDGSKNYPGSPDYSVMADAATVMPSSAFGLDTAAKIAEADEIGFTIKYPALQVINLQKGDKETAFAFYVMQIRFEQNNAYGPWKALFPSRGDYVKHSANTNAPISFDHQVNLDGYRNIVGPFEDFQVRILRVTRHIGLPVRSSGKNENDTNKKKWQLSAQASVESLRAVIKDNFSYPYSSIASVSFSSKQFSSIPKRSYLLQGKLVQVPSTYTPREYSNTGIAKYEGFWDGTFHSAPVYTDNPAWVFYDIVTNNRYGAGKWITDTEIDKFALYRIARYCDELVDDGSEYDSTKPLEVGNFYRISTAGNTTWTSLGAADNNVDTIFQATGTTISGTGIAYGVEPRFRANVFLTKATDVYKVLKDFATIFLGIIYWQDSKITTVQDAPQDPIYNFTKGNVIDGAFSYESSGSRTRTNQVVVTWNDPTINYEPVPLVVEDRESIVRTGRIISQNAVAFGATSESQAIRYGRWKLWTAQNQTEIISFKTSLAAHYVKPGDVINVQDSDRFAVSYSGRTSSATSTTLTFDRNVSFNAGSTYELSTLVTSPAALNASEGSITINSVTYERGEKIDQAYVYNGSSYVLVNLDTEERASNAFIDSSGSELIPTIWKPYSYIEMHEITNPGSTASTVTLANSATFDTTPSKHNIWALKETSGGLNVLGSEKMYKVLSIAEEEANIFAISAVEYFNEKFIAVEEEYELGTIPPSIYIANEPTTIPRPTNPRVILATDAGSPGEELILEWDEAESDAIVRYEVLHTIPELDNPIKTDKNRIILNNVPNGSVTFKIRAISRQGNISSYTAINYGVYDPYGENVPRMAGGIPKGIVATSQGKINSSNQFEFQAANTRVASVAAPFVPYIITGTKNVANISTDEEYYLYLDTASPSLKLLEYNSTALSGLQFYRDVGTGNSAISTAWTSIGTVSVAANSNEVTGSGFNTNVKLRDVLNLQNSTSPSGGDGGVVISIISDTRLLIDRTFATAKSSITGYRSTFRPDYANDAIFAEITKTGSTISTNNFITLRTLSDDTNGTTETSDDGTVGVPDGGIGADQISANSINADKIAANSITTDQLAANSITADQIAANTITTDQLAANSITADQITANSVVSSLITASTILSSHIKSNSIVATIIDAESITAADIQTATISALSADLGDITAGTMKGGSIPDANNAPGGSETGAFMDLNAGKMVFGNASKHILFDGTDLILSGVTIDAQSIVNANAPLLVKEDGTTEAERATSLNFTSGLNVTVVGDEATINLDVPTDNNFTTGEKTKLAGISTGANAYVLPVATTSTVGGVSIGARLTVDGAGDISANIQSDNNFTTTLLNKLNAIEAGATADQTAAEIRSLVEGASDSNVFTDADHTKLNSVASGANAYVLPTNNVTNASVSGNTLTLSREAATNVTFVNTEYSAGSGLGLSGTTFSVDGTVVRTTGTQSIAGNKTFTGNVTFSGTTTYINTTTLNVGDNIITLNADFTGSSPTESAGIEVERGTQSNKTFIWKESSDRWSFGSEAVEAGTFFGSFIGSITGSPSSLAGLSTDDLAEGSTNLYFTTTRARGALSGSTGISYNNTTGAITNSAPDRTVTLTGGGATTVSGTYPNFTISSTDTDTNTITQIREDSGSYRTGNITLQSGTNVTITEPSAGVFNFASTNTNTTNFNIQANGGATENISAGETINFIGSGTTSVSRSGNSITISSSASTNNYVSSASFNTGNGIITLNRQGLSAVTVDIDGRFINNTSTQPNNIYIRNTSPTIYLRDQDHISSMIHQNSNLFYILRADAADDASWTPFSTSDAANGRWPLQMNLTNSGHYVYFGSPNLQAGGHTVWHAGNDGPGSGLNADVLDNQDGSYYLNYNNFTNTPSIPSGANNATITLNAGNGLTTGGAFTTNQGSNETISFHVGAGDGISVAANAVAVDSTVLRTGTGTLINDIINANVITADMIQANSIVATLINADTISANNITTGTLDATNVTISNLSANSITGDVSEHFNSFFETPLNKRYAFTGGSNAIPTTPFSVPAPNGGISKRLYISGWLGISKSSNDQRVIVFVEQKGFTVSSINLGQLIQGNGDSPEDNIRELIYSGDVLGQGAFPGGQISRTSTFSQSGNNVDVWGYNYDSSTNRTTIWVDGSNDAGFIPSTSNDPHYWHAGPQSSTTWVRVGETIGIGDFSTSSIDPYIVVPISFVLPAQSTAGQLRVGVVLAPGESTSGYAIRGWNCNFGWLR